MAFATPAKFYAVIDGATVEIQVYPNDPTPIAYAVIDGATVAVYANLGDSGGPTPPSVSTVPQSTLMEYVSSQSFASETINFPVGMPVTIGPGLEQNKTLFKTVLRTRVLSVFQAESHVQGKIRSTFAANSMLSYALRAVFEQENKVGGNIRAIFKQDYVIVDKLRSAFDARSDMLNASRLLFDSEQTILDHNPVRAPFVAVNYSLDTDPEVCVQSVVALVNGVEVGIEEFIVEVDEARFAWTGKMVLTNHRDAELFTPETEILVTVAPGESWFFVCVQVSKGKVGEATRTATVTGLTPIVLLDNPYTELVEKTFPTPRYAQSIAEELLGDYPMTWGTVNWRLPAFRFGVTNSSPIKAVADLAKAVGAVIDPEPMGDITVRKSFAVQVPNFSAETADIFLSYTDIFEYSEEASADIIYNKFRIMDVTSSSQSDKVEFEADEADYLAGRVKVYPSPWRTEIGLSHTAPNAVSISILGTQYEEKTEEVEFVAGEGNTQYPIDSIVNVEWLSVSLGGLSFDDYTTQLRPTNVEALYGLANITYRTRAIMFRVVSTVSPVVQFLVEDLRDG